MDAESPRVTHAGQAVTQPHTLASRYTSEVMGPCWPDPLLGSGTGPVRGWGKATGARRAGDRHKTLPAASGGWQPESEWRVSVTQLPRPLSLAPWSHYPCNKYFSA